MYLVTLAKRINNHEYDNQIYLESEVDLEETGEVSLSMDRNDVGIYISLTKDFEKLVYNDHVKKYLTIKYVQAIYNYNGTSQQFISHG